MLALTWIMNVISATLEEVWVDLVLKRLRILPASREQTLSYLTKRINAKTQASILSHKVIERFLETFALEELI